MKITDIQAQVKLKGRYSVFIDGKFAFGLSELGLLNSGLRIGQELNSDELTALKERANTDKIYNQTLALLARRPRSRWEITDYLKRKKVDQAVAEDILSQLEARGFIDDIDFGRRWVESRRLLKPISRRKLELELRAKRLSDEVVKEVMSEDETDEFSVLQAEIEKKRRQSKYQDSTKLMQYLARQGYSYDDIKRALTSNTG